MHYVPSSIKYFDFYILSTYETSLKKVRRKTPWPESASDYSGRATAPVGEASANFCRLRASRGQRDGSLRPYFLFSRPG
jgi:hypothetical protein